MKLLVALSLLVASSHATLHPQTLHVCNRGYCYTKKTPLTINGGARKKTGINFCHGGHCELFDILGTDRVDAEFEAMECTTEECRRMQEQAVLEEKATLASATLYDAEGEAIAEEFVDLDERVSWKDEPLRGRCYDNELRYEFDCNLVEILDDGLVLIEDLRAGGIFAAQPKSNFSTRKASRTHQEPPTPKVMIGSGIADPNEDFRTNVSLNLEGI